MQVNNILPYVLTNLSEAVIVVNLNLEVRFINTGSEKLFKFTSRQFLGKKLELLFEDTPAYDDFVQNILNLKDQNTANSTTLNILDTPNNKIPVSVSVKIISNKQKNAAGFILILKNMSEIQKNNRVLEEKTKEINKKTELIQKMQSEVELEKSSAENQARNIKTTLEKEHAKLLASVDNLSLCFLITDKYYNIILNNQTSRDLFPFLNKGKIITVTELQNTALMDIDLESQIKKAMTGKKCVKNTNIQIDSGYIDIFISPIILESSLRPEAIGATIIIEDQTKHHELERSKEDLFNIASHELRTPLTAIYGYTALIKQIFFGNIQNEELRMIINNIGILSKKLSLSVSNFLDSSKLEQGKIELKEEQCNLFTLINDSIKEMEVVAQWKNLYIKFDPPSSPIIINADRIRVTQIMNILISNAIKFTQTGGIYISVETKSNYAKIIIKDTGAGISEENKKLLFRKFQQTGDNLLTREEGTGLGLHLAKLLIEKMGGTVVLEKTEINKGSEFSFTIPMINN